MSTAEIRERVVAQFIETPLHKKGGDGFDHPSVRPHSAALGPTKPLREMSTKKFKISERTLLGKKNAKEQNKKPVILRTEKLQI